MKKFGSLYLNLDTNKKYAVLFPFLFLIRRCLYAFSLAFFSSTNHLLQLAIQIYSSIALLGYILMIMPFEDPLLNYMELFNESSILATSYFLLAFTDFVPEAETRYTIGWVFSGVVALNLVVNWIILFTRLAK